MKACSALRTLAALGLSGHAKEMAIAPSSSLRPAKGQGKHKQRKLKSKSGKGKALSGKSTSSKKYRDVPASKLPWRASKDANYDFDDFQAGEGGMLELEEIDDVDVVWEERPDGSKTVKFKVSCPVACTKKSCDRVAEMQNWWLSLHC